MKTRIIIATAFTVLSLGIVTSVFATSNQTEEKPVAKSIETVSSAGKQGVTAPIEPAEQTQAPAEVQPIKVEEAPAVVAPTYVPKEEVFTKALGKLSTELPDSPLKLKIAPISGAILGNYETHKELFTVEAFNGTVDRCVAYYETLTPQEMQLAIAKNDCGF